MIVYYCGTQYTIKYFSSQHCSDGCLLEETLTDKRHRTGMLFYGSRWSNPIIIIIKLFYVSFEISLFPSSSVSSYYYLIVTDIIIIAHKLKIFRQK